MQKMTEELLNSKELGEKLRRGKTWVWRLKKSGYSFKYGGLTTVWHCLAWLEKHPEFKSTQHYDTTR